MRTPKPDENGIRWYGSRGMRKRQVPGRCIEEVSDHDARWASYYQCSRKATHGDYCKRHATVTGCETWWRVSKYSAKPEAFEFSGSTDAQLIHSNGRREAKSSNYYEYFPSKEMALKVIESRITREIEQYALRSKELGEALAAVQAELAKESV